MLGGLRSMQQLRLKGVRYMAEFSGKARVRACTATDLRPRRA